MSSFKRCLFRLAPLLMLMPPAVRAVFDNAELILAPGDYLDLGQLDRLEYLMLMIIVTVFFVAWAVGVLPVDVPLSPYAWRRKREAMTTEGALNSIMWDCPLQFVCEVDHWANRDHDYFIESMVAKWLRNSSNNTFYSAQGKVFGGLPETCAEMYPCPFDIQEVVGIRIPGSSGDNGLDVDHPDPDAYMSLL